MEKSKVYGSVRVVAAVFFLLTFSSEAKAGGVDVHIGIGFPFPGYVVVPTGFISSSAACGSGSGSLQLPQTGCAASSWLPSPAWLPPYD